jgi:hypothetical protein
MTLGPERFQLKDLSKQVQDNVGTEIGKYTVPLVLDWRFIGSGTLIRFGECHGVLTASHVVSNKDWQINAGAYSKQTLRTAVAEYAHDLSIEARRLEIERTIRKSDEYGPDLAFIRIPDSEFLHAILPRKSFFDICSSAEKKFAEAGKSDGIMVFSGFPEADRFDGQPELGFDIVHGLIGYGFITGREHEEEREGYDYIEVGASYAGDNKPPVSFGGVSGGGLWQVPVFRKKDHGLGQEYYEGIFLAGVVIYETPIVNDYRRIRGHGPKSLYKIFFPQLEQRFGV